MKIQVTSCVKTSEWNGKPIYTLQTDQGELQCWEELKAGEHEGDVVQPKDPKYKPTFKPSGNRKAPMKDYTLEKKRVALEQAVALVASGHIKLEQLAEKRDNFFDYLR